MNRFIIFLVLLVGTACLDPGPPPRGIRLIEGRDILDPTFITLGGETWVRFERHKAYAHGPLGAVSDIWLVSLDGSNAKLVVKNRSDHGPTLQSFPAGSNRVQHFLVDERSVNNRITTSTLIRLSSTFEERLRIEGITRYQLGSAPSFPDLVLYEKPRAEASYQDLYLWDGSEHRYLGVDSGSGLITSGSSGAIYAIFGEDRVFSRLPRPDGALAGLRSQVTRFMVSPGEKFAALSVRDGDKAKDIILELETKREIPFAKSPSGLWAGFQNNFFVYLTGKTSASPAEIHAIDLLTAEETVRALPEPLVDVVIQLPRPGADEILLQDSVGSAVFVSSVDGALLRTLPGKIYSPKFTKDGTRLLYIDPEPPTLIDPQIHGPLMEIASDLSTAPRLFSPPGTSTRAGFYNFTAGERGDFLYFWVHFGRGNWDLYFAYFDTGELRLVTRSILQVTVSEFSIFGIINASQQDQTGDLVNRNLIAGTEVLFSRAVAVAVVNEGTPESPGSKIAYVVRGRAPSAHDGLWLTPMQEPPIPDAGVSK